MDASETVMRGISKSSRSRWLYSKSLLSLASDRFCGFLWLIMVMKCKKEKKKVESVLKDVHSWEKPKRCTCVTSTVTQSRLVQDWFVEQVHDSLTTHRMDPSQNPILPSSQLIKGFNRNLNSCKWHPSRDKSSPSINYSFQVSNKIVL